MRTAREIGTAEHNIAERDYLARLFFPEIISARFGLSRVFELKMNYSRAINDEQTPGNLPGKGVYFMYANIALLVARNK